MGAYNNGMHPTRLNGVFMRETPAIRRYARAGDAERYALPFGNVLFGPHGSSVYNVCRGAK